MDGKEGGEASSLRLPLIGLIRGIGVFSLGGEQRVQVEGGNDKRIFIMTVGCNIPNLRSKVWRSRVVETIHIFIFEVGFLVYMLDGGQVGRRDRQQHRRSFVPARRVACMAA